MKVGIRGVDSGRVSNLREEIDIFLLAMKNENPDGQQDRIDGESNHACCSPNPQPERRREYKSILAAVEKNRQCPSQHDAEQRDNPNENAEHASLKRGTNRSSPVHRASRRTLLPLRRGQPRLYESLGRKLVNRGLQVRGNSSIRNRNLHVDLRSPALRTKRPSILDRGPTLLARVFHVFEASAQRTRRARHPAIESSTELPTTRSPDAVRSCRPSPCGSAHKPAQSGFPGCCA